MLESFQVSRPAKADPAPAAKPGHRIEILATLFLFLLYFGVTAALQRASGAYASDFAGYPDEPGHYVTGLMVRDYIAGMFPRSPLQFAESYYLHYPKVAFGHWPPVFYILEAGWMLVFPDSRGSALLLMSVMTTIIALLICREAKNRFGMIYGVVAGLLWVCLPVVQALTSMVMAEVPMAIFTFLAILRLARFLEDDRWQDAVWFGIWSSVAILTKGNAWALSLAPPLALLLTRDFRRVMTARFWIPVAIVLVVCGPYHVLTWKMIHHGWPSDPGGLGGTIGALPLLSGYLVDTVGWPLFLLVLLGFYSKVVVPWRRSSVDNYWAAMAALIAGFFVFHAVLYHSIAELRYYVIIAPAMVLFVMAGIEWLLDASFLRGLAPAWRAVLVGLCAGGAFIVWTFRIPPRPAHGFRNVAQKLLSTRELDDTVFLISSSGYGEGMFIAEIAEHEKRPSHIVLRATQQLAQSSWTGEDYALRYETPEQVEKALEDIPVSVIVVHSTRPAQVSFAHHQLLIDTLQNYPEDWERIASYSASSAEEILVYRFRKPLDRRPRHITVDLTNKIDKVLNGKF